MAPTYRPTLAARLAAFLADLEGGFRTWHLARGRRAATVAHELRAVAEFTHFVDRPLWEWRPQDYEHYAAALLGRNAPSTIATKQHAVRRFLEYARDPAYAWDERCFALTGRHIPFFERSRSLVYGRKSLRRRT